MFYNEDQPNPSKRCKCLAAALKEAFSNCHAFGGKLPSASPDEENPPSDVDDEEEVVVSAIRSKAREAKLRRKTSLISGSFKLDSFSRVFSPGTGELFATPKELQQREDDDDDEEDDEEREDYFSVRSYLSRASSVASREAFLSVKTNFSRSSSLSGIDFYEFRRPSIIEELCHCEGWPFGLCRRAMLLPPLPKSPSESWSWRKGTRVVKMN